MGGSGKRTDPEYFWGQVNARCTPYFTATLFRGARARLVQPDNCTQSLKSIRLVFAAAIFVVFILYGTRGR